VVEPVLVVPVLLLVVVVPVVLLVAVVEPSSSRTRSPADGFVPAAAR